MIEINTTRSSMLKTIAYDDSKKELIVTFASGGTYKYEEVPKSVFNEMINAESEGKYFLANIKGKYKFEKE